MTVVEDFHAKTCLLEFFWKSMYNSSSMIDGGTLIYLRNHIKRHNVVKTHKDRLAGSEDFFFWWLSPIMLLLLSRFFEMSSVDEILATHLFQRNHQISTHWNAEIMY